MPSPREAKAESIAGRGGIEGRREEGNDPRRPLVIGKQGVSAGAVIGKAGVSVLIER